MIVVVFFFLGRKKKKKKTWKNSRVNRVLEATSPFSCFVFFFTPSVFFPTFQRRNDRINEGLPVDNVTTKLAARALRLASFFRLVSFLPRSSALATEFYRVFFIGPHRTLPDSIRVLCPVLSACNRLATRSYIGFFTEFFSVHDIHSSVQVPA